MHKYFKKKSSGFINYFLIYNFLIYQGLYPRGMYLAEVGAYRFF